VPYDAYLALSQRLVRVERLAAGRPARDELAALLVDARTWLERERAAGAGEHELAAARDALRRVAAAARRLRRAGGPRAARSFE
jgi:hypothetical protein